MLTIVFFFIDFPRVIVYIIYHIAIIYIVFDFHFDKTFHIRCYLMLENNYLKINLKIYCLFFDVQGGICIDIQLSDVVRYTSAKILFNLQTAALNMDMYQGELLEKKEKKNEINISFFKTFKKLTYLLYLNI